MGWVFSFFSGLKAEVEWLITSLAVAPATNDSATAQDGTPAEAAVAHHNDSAPAPHSVVLALADQQRDGNSSADATPAQHENDDNAPASGVQDIAFTLQHTDDLLTSAVLQSDSPVQAPAVLTPLSLTGNFSATEPATPADSAAHEVQAIGFSGLAADNHSESHFAQPNPGAGDFELASLTSEGYGFAQGGSGSSGSSTSNNFQSASITSNNGGTTPFIITLWLDSNLTNLQTSNPSEYTQITNDLQAVANFFADHFTNNPNDPTHPDHSFNVNVGWGDVLGSSLPSGAVGESSYSVYATSYSALQTGFTNYPVANETASGSEVVNIPAQEPFSSTNPTFMVTAAQKHALNIPISGGTQYGSVGFSSAANTFFFDPTHPVVGEYDFMGIAAHEISEVLGRVTLNGAGKSHELASLDLFHFGDSNAAPTYSGTAPGYFSVDNGATNVVEFNATSSGDHGDWATTGAPDAFDSTPPSGVDLPFSYADYLAMEAAGYSGNFHYDTSLSQTTADWNTANPAGSF